jgi:phospholipid/cholesterol/gamma-HCH transport system substrate-binding protein
VISRRTKIQLTVFLIVALLGVTYTGARYANLGRFVPGYDKGFLVTADFVDSGGIFVGAQVTYRGVAIGQVEKLELLPDGVGVELRLKPGTKVPSPVRAVVGNRSAIGEQYVDLQPQTDGPEFLTKGSVIPASMTAIPILPTTLVVDLDRLVRSVNLNDVTVVLDELGRAVDGTGDDLQRLIDASDELTTTANDHLTQTLALIRDSQPVLATQRQVAGAFRSYNADLAQLTTQLRASDPDFRTLFRTGADAAGQTTALLEANRAALPVLLGNLAFVAQVQAVRIPALRQILVTYPNVVAGGFTVTPGDGTAHFGFVSSNTPGVCPASDPGYAGTKRRDPSDNTPRASNFKAYCSLGKGSTADVRGAARAPRAEGLPPYPHDGTGGSSPTVKGAGLSSRAGWATMFADYDPTTGHAVTTEGQRYTVSSTMGSAAIFGANSWQWLLMEPLRHS